ncbi:MAG: restriction endonuclease subunit S, partial [Bacillota bacterium]
MYRRYEKYKDSGIEWIGEVPEHWKGYKIKRLFGLLGGNGFNESLQGKKEGDYPFYKVSDINYGNTVIEKAGNYVDKNEVVANHWNIIPSESIITAKIGEALRKNHRKINKAECLIDNNMLALIPNELIIKKWLAYYLFCIIDMEWFVNPGAVPSVNIRWFRNSKLIIMPLSEQKAIANYLDHKTSEIDSLIADKETLIKKLEEYKQSIITEAVTKGLNPNVKMKDSGIEWIGEIPGHWEVK